MSPRPKELDESVCRRAAEILAPHIHEWLDGKDDLEGIVADLMRIRSWPNDGYSFAKELERLHYEPDAVLVELLDGSCAMRKAHEEAVRAWVIANGITPALATGDRCTFTGFWRGTKSGVVSGILAERGVYTVIPDDEREKFAGGGGWVLPYEGVQPEQRAEPEIAQ
ncbi:MAG: hypothetical protein A3E01_10045 [Gammaproteobacteria bacterium RIFCSPHIGHO2_12_FULL_63_22]|nr:MAG: hypothetical protein A3E01_10045 [Gammaproteobacteria bacterium RIFCSPHIGHO2_12_FULL_63_22]